MKKVLVMLLMSTLGLTQTMADNNTMVKKFSNVATAVAETRASAFSGGAGTQEDPYLISTAEDLNQFSADVQNKNMYEGKYFKMTNDIDMSATENFLPIGNNIESSDVKAFCGTFDGNNFTITGLKCDYKGVNSIGVAMFGVTMNATIKNLRMNDCSFSADALVAPVVAVAMGTTVQNCHIGNNVVVDAYKMFNAGGVVCGAMGMPCTIEDCSSAADVHAKSYTAGGILSAISEQAGGTVVRRCVFYGKSESFETVAGIVALLEQPGVIEDCANFGQIISGTGAAGIQYVYNSQAKDFVKVSNCYNAGLVQGVDEDHQDAVSFGNIYHGGGEGSCTVTNCYYEDTMSGASSITSTAMTAAEMKTTDFVEKLNNGRTEGPWCIIEGVADGFPVPFAGLIPTSIKDVEASAAAISFNAGVATVAGVKAGDKFAVVDMAGRTVKMAVAQNNGNLTIDMTNLPAGVYAIGNGSISKKIVK